MDGYRSVEVREPGRQPLWIVITDRLALGRAGDGLLLTGERISRHHCELRIDGDRLLACDAGSSNGTFLNGSPLLGTQPVVAGDEITIGDTVIVVDPDCADDRADGRENGDAELTSTVIGSVDTVVDQDATISDELRASVVGGTITMVFSDIVDSTVLNGQLGDQVWFDLLNQHNAIIRNQAGRYRGTEIKTQGDGFMLTFPSARHALLFGISVQRDLARARADHDDFVLRVRIGVHTGEVIHKSGDIFGRHVNLAARVSGTADADEVVASQLVYDLTSPMNDLEFDEPRAVTLKGFEGDHQVFPLRW